MEDLEEKEANVAKDVDLSEQRIYRRFSTPGDHRAKVHIPRSMATAPFLKPDSGSERVFVQCGLVSQRRQSPETSSALNYMNIYTAASEQKLLRLKSPQIQQLKTTIKLKGKTIAAAKNYGKTTLPKIHKRQPKRLKTPVSKQRKKLATPPKPKKKVQMCLCELRPMMMTTMMTMKSG
ncbi:hypothetical protein WMY93_016581 [Mugilogobius chulae]|uniref:Uncharacterized protein n=1 Tax=Mugilogobius chulae TaxID=88201 RepID=A0AAW0NQ34_9GOBI